MSENGNEKTFCSNCNLEVQESDVEEGSWFHVGTGAPHCRLQIAAPRPAPCQNGSHDGLVLTTDDDTGIIVALGCTACGATATVTWSE